MKTNFHPAQLDDPAMRSSEKVLRTCVHCGFCTATCPTYLLLGDELDSPRGRIYLIKSMLEDGTAPTQEVVKHVDRCLSCLSCMTTCPSGVDYMHLVDHARAYIENTYSRPVLDRLFRWGLAKVLPYPSRFRMLLPLGAAARPLSGLIKRIPRVGDRLAAMLALIPSSTPTMQVRPIQVTKARHRVSILRGCAQPVLRPSYNAAAERLLSRHGVEIVDVPEQGCCGAIVHHLGREVEALRFVRQNVDAWFNEIEKGLDAIIITASGCGTTIKDYGFMLRNEPAYADRAAKVSAITKDVTEFLIELGPLDFVERPKLTVAYHSACSMQHGQQIRDEPKSLLRAAGFDVKDIPESHICCGSAGTYNVLQPQIASQLRDRKITNIAKVNPQVIATGNVGCAVQLESGADIPVVHTVELLDWATGGPVPDALAKICETKIGSCSARRSPARRRPLSLTNPVHTETNLTAEQD
ncbi:MAG: glycolate oxidase iron-sulfur subunit [Pseudonocardiaceae bacterium]|nr:MAG: glycolate oxidase iron-sulfur subunit [Pseudonocardiaceae bacterium]